MSHYLSAAALAIGILASGAARAEDLPLDQYDKMKDSSEFEFYIVGVTNGFEWANAELSSRKQDPLYCLPAEHALVKAESLALLEEQIAIIRSPEPATAKDKADRDALSVSLILLRALEQKYPCVGKI